MSTCFLKKSNNIKDYITYYVNEEKGVVVAKITKDDVLELISSSLCGTRAPWPIYNTVQDIVAKATCSLHDSFDIDIGIEIATRRIMNKFDKRLIKIYDDYSIELFRERTEIFKRIHDACSRIEKGEKAIKKIGRVNE